MNNNRAVTLLELVIAISLFGLVFLSVSTLDLFSRTQFLKIDLRTQLQNELSPALEDIRKGIMRGVGDATNESVRFPFANTMDTRIDINCMPWGTGCTPGNYADDVWQRYSYNSSMHSIRFYPDASVNSYRVLSAKILNASFSRSPSNYGMIIINVTARTDPTKSESSENVEINLIVNAALRSASLQ